MGTMVVATTVWEGWLKVARGMMVELFVFVWQQLCLQNVGLRNVC